MTENDFSIKKLEEFRLEYKKLLAKYPDLSVLQNINGDIYACTGRYRIFLLGCAPVGK